MRPDETHEIFSQPETQIGIDEAPAVRTIELSLQVRTAYPLQDGECHEVDGTTQIGVRNIQFTEAIVPRNAQGNTDLQNPTSVPTLTPGKGEG